MTTGSKRFADTSSTASQWRQFTPLEETKIEVLDLEVERLEVKIGTLKVDLDHRGFGAVELDGRAVRCRAFSIDYSAGELPRIRLEIFPIPDCKPEQKIEERRDG